MVELLSNSKAEQLASHFQKLIEKGELAPGQPLGTKSDLLNRHGIAAGTLNEALRLLQARGYIEVKPGPKGGSFVADQTKRLRLRHTFLDTSGDPEEVSDAIKVRDELEVLVAVEAARNCTAEDAERILAAEKRVMESEPGRDRLLKIWALHREIALTGKNKILTAYYNDLLKFLENSVSSVEVSASVPSGVSGKTDEVHHNLVQAVINNDLERAIAAAREHTPIGKDYYLNPTRNLR